MASVALEHIDRVFMDRKRRVHAVRDLCLQVNDGELLTLVGPSGCGKTTTLRVIAGLDEPSGGIVRIEDRVVNRVQPKDRDVAMVFQNYALYPHMTVYQNIAFPLKMRKLPKVEIHRKVGETADRMGLSALLNRKPATLSGGEKQRTAVARAMIRDPKVFLFDEPLSNLDVPLRIELRNEIKRLQRSLKTTTVYVTHDQEEAMILGDRIAVMRQGVLQQCGTPREVHDHPANRFVAGFIGTPAMNLIAGTIVESGGAKEFQFGERRFPISKSLHGPELPIGPLVMGVRPQDVHFQIPSISQHDQQLVTAGEGVVRLVETTGDAMNVRVVLENREIIARTTSGSSICENNRMQISFNIARAHFFRAGESGERIS